jgi:hypothetical protein
VVVVVVLVLLLLLLTVNPPTCYGPSRPQRRPWAQQLLRRLGDRAYLTD